MKGRVLVIDDEPEIRRNLTFGLMQEEYHVTACPDGISAVHELDRARKEGEHYDFLVTDIFMPDIDGLKILRVIKSQYPDLPVVVITGFGDESLEFTARSEHNTEYLDKPFEIPDLVATMERLQPGQTAAGDHAEPTPQAEPVREVVSAYLTIRITDPDRSMEIFDELRGLEGVESCDAVHGDVDIILLAHAHSPEGIQTLFDQVGQVEGIEVASMSPVERPKLERDVDQFVKLYRQAVKTPASDAARGSSGAASYFIVDIEPGAIQEIFTTVFFIDDVIFCDVIEDGTKLVGMITGADAVGRTPRIIEKINEIDGVLRVRVARIIRLLDD